MTKKHRHLVTALGVGAIAASIFVGVAWVLITGEIRESHGSRGKYTLPSVRPSEPAPYTIYTRKDNPGKYWTFVGVVGFFGLLTGAGAVWAYRSYLLHRDYPRDGNSRTDLLTRIDRACRLHPQERETLLRARAAVVDLKDAEVEAALDYFLDKVLGAHDREAALRDIQSLAKALDRIGKY
jgi:hypothetical protein